MSAVFLLLVCLFTPQYTIHFNEINQLAHNYCLTYTFKKKCIRTFIYPPFRSLFLHYTKANFHISASHNFPPADIYCSKLFSQPHCLNSFISQLFWGHRMVSVREKNASELLAMKSKPTQRRRQSSGHIKLPYSGRTLSCETE